MKSIFVKIGALALISLLCMSEVSAYSYRVPSRSRSQRDYRYDNRQYTPNYYQQNYYQPSYNYTYAVSCPSFSNVGVGVGSITNGVMVTVSSSDTTLQNCIKNMNWAPYFTRYGSNISLSISATTLGMQITATSYDSYTTSALQNGNWVTTITSIPGYTYYAQYNPPQTYTPPTNYPPGYYNPQYNYNPSYNYTPPYNYNPPYNYAPPSYDNSSRRGTVVFGNVSQISRSLSYLSNGVQMNFTSNDYNTMVYLQRFSFTSIFAHLSGVSISQSNISWGTQVTVTVGNTSTIQEVQNIGYALVYQ